MTPRSAATGGEQAISHAARRRLQHLTPLVSIILLAVALWLLHREFAAHHPRQIVGAIRAIPIGRVLAALGLTIASYAFLPAYDALGLQYVKQRLAYGRIMLVGFLAYAFSQSLGFALVTGGSLRYRLYSAWGLSVVEVGQVIAVAAAAFWLGMTTLAGLALTMTPGAVLRATPLSPALGRLVGILLLAIPAGYLTFSVVRQRSFAFHGWELRPPGRSLAVAQVVVGSIDWIVAAAVAYVLLPPTAGVSFVAFVGVFVLAQVLGLVSHVPGGLGVFETTVVLLLRGVATPPAIVGSLLAYRVVYYLLPFTTAAALLVGYELRARRPAVARVAHAAACFLPGLVPRALAVVTFAVGAILIVSGSLPAESSRLAFLGDLVPLSVIEVSHFVGSVAGVGLLILAWGIAHRLDGAFHVAVALLALGVAVSLLKGIDYEEAAASGAVLLALLAARRHFDRPTSLLHEPLSIPWVVAIGTVLVTAFWIGLFAFRHEPYRGELWWRFALHGDAPRFLRASVGIFVAVGAFALGRLLRPAMPAALAPSPADLGDVTRIATAAARTYANLVFLGDKAVLVHESRSAFLMYGISGRSWIVMGDPVGSEVASTDLVWRFRELVDDHGGLTVFYQVSPELLPVYLDLGLRPLKLGEEGRVPLATFSVEGGSRKSLRRVKRQIEKEGGAFALLTPAGAAHAMDELRAVSDAWLADKQTREKGFSLGRFDPAYVARFPAAVVRVNGRVAAFATVWESGERAELSIDLMRYRPDAPDGMMDYLLTELMQWGAAQGYQWFNLGMAPLSGFEVRALAPLWNRVNALVFRHGEHFYHFQGLRQYKEKFDPVWSPRYLAAPGGLALPRVLADLAALISGGLMGVVTK